MARTYRDSMFAEPSIAAKVVFVGWQHRAQILSALGKLKHRAWYGPLDIVVFGPEGTGKSSLGKLLSGSVDPRANLRSYEESKTIEPYDLGGLDGYISGNVKVPPGQERHRPTQWRKLFGDLAGGKAKGVINVVSWGYDPLRVLSYKDATDYYEDGMSKEDFLDRFLLARRDSLTLSKALLLDKADGVSSLRVRI